MSPPTASTTATVRYTTSSPGSAARTAAAAVVGRVGGAVAVLAVVSLLTFVLLTFTDGDAATAIVLRRDGDVTAQAVQLERARLGLDQPLLVRYATSISRALHGDFGVSLQDGTPVAAEVAARVGPTARLASSAALLAVVGGAVLGVVAALTRSRWVTVPLRLAALGALSLPSFALAYLGVLTLGLWLHWVPTQGMGGVRSAVLPGLVLGLPLAAALSRVTEARLRATMTEPYVTTARARGLTEAACLLRHGLPNAAAPLLVVFGNYVGYAIAGTLVVETIFGWPGLGAYLVRALQFRDWYPLQASVLVIAAAAVLIRGLAGTLAAVVDPRTTSR